LDANIFISSFFWGGNPRDVLQRAIIKLDELYISKEILNEIEDVMGRKKFHAEKTEIDYFINSIEEISNKIAPKKTIKNGSRDKTDNKYIECGITGNVDYIISGDIHLLEMRKYDTIKIISAREYLEIMNLPALKGGVHR
jgi:putative PIN family toxin of toxin-antitoxin system